MRCLSWESPGTARLVLVLTGKRAHSVGGIRARNPSHTQGSELELQYLRRFRPTAQQTWRRDWPERRPRDCDVTCSNENSLKKLTHYEDREGIPLGGWGGQRAPLCFSQIAPEVLGISLWNLPYLSEQQFHTLCQKIMTQVIIGQPWVTSEWHHVSPISISKMGLRESPPLVQF